jgi:multidrug efflux pump
MLGVTFFGVFLTPVFYTVIRKLSGDKPIIAPGHDVADAVVGVPDVTQTVH